MLPSKSPKYSDFDKNFGASDGANGAQAHNSDSPLSDGLERLRSVFGERAPQTLAEIINAYLKEAPERLEQIRQAQEQAQALPLYRAAHTLKSSSALLGAIQLAQLCQQLESSAQAGDLSSTKNLVLCLEAEYNRVKAALESELSRS